MATVTSKTEEVLASRKRKQGLALFVPAVWGLCFLSNTIAVLLHEVVGHGLTARFLGGSFRGFTFTGFSGASFSYLPPNAPTLHEIIQLAAGNALTLAAGSIMLGVQARMRLSGEAWMVLLLLGGGCLVSAFNSFVGGMFDGIGDATRIVVLTNDSVLAKAFFLTAGPVGLVVLPVYLFRQVLHIGNLFMPLASLQARLAFLLVVAGLPLALVILMFPSFPVPAVGRVPLKLSLISVLALVLAILAKADLPAGKSARLFRIGFALSIIALAVIAGALTHFWLAKGVYF